MLALLAVTSGVQTVFGQDVASSPISPSPSDSGNAILLESRSSKGFCTNGSKGTLRVPGQGIKEAKSDQAQVSMNVQVTAETAMAARDQASTLANSVIGNLSAINGIGSENAQTTSVSISPQYNNSDSSNDIIGYMYTYGLDVTVKNLTSNLLSKVLDTAVAAGGNQLQIQQVSFSLSDAATAQAMVATRKLSVASAKAAADIYASELKVTLGGISSVVSTSASSAPQSSTSQKTSNSNALFGGPSAAAAPSTPISIGQQTVTDSITVEYFICSPSA
ncbi:g1598 [Coccomyxa elongata]